MKKFFPLLLINSLVVFLFITLSSCEGPLGPQGPAGAAGTQGPKGDPGKDANGFCKLCHNNTKQEAIVAEWATSLHASGSSWASEGTNKTCVGCHNEDGFIETARSGLDTMAVAPKIGYALGCEGCHDFHNSLDSAEFPDYALRITTPWKLKLFPTITYTAHKNSYVCAKCHQPRLPSPMPSMTLMDSISTTNYRYGVHYGVQAVIYGGKGAFEFPGSATYENSSHTANVSCGTCHMAATMGTGSNMAGGHTYRMTDTTGKDNVAGCVRCHSGITDFDVNGKQTEIEGLIAQLGAKIDALPGGPYLEKVNGEYTGYINLPNPNPAPAKKIKLPQKYFAAIINFQILIRDKSNGAHNYKYTKALVNNTIAALP